MASIAACGPGIPHPDLRENAASVLVSASGDVGALERLMQGSVMVAGMWFDDPSCAAFSGGGKVMPERFHELARCLATVHWAQSSRTDTLADTTVLTYPPGLEIEARVVQELSGPRLTWIGYVARRDVRDALPTISPQALEALRVAGDRDGPLDPERARTVELDLAPPGHGALAWFKVCIDATGAITSVQSREATSIAARDAFADAIAKWQFRPFIANGHAIPVCAMTRLEYPRGSAPKAEVIPLPAPLSRKNKEPIVFPPNAKFVEAKRIAGSKLIIPDDRVKLAIYYKHGNETVRGAFRLCLDETGHVESVLPLKSTGYASYDRELMAEIWKWVYSPFLVDGIATPVCTEVMFIYSQG